MRSSQLSVIGLCVLLGVLAPANLDAAPRVDGGLQLDLVDSKTGEPIPARLHLKTARGKPVPLRMPGTSEFADHFYADGRIVLPLKPGQYLVEIEATPEYRTITSHPFEIGPHADDQKKIQLERFANLNDEGWWAGDIDVARPLSDLSLAMRAEGLNVVTDRAPNAKLDKAARRLQAESDKSDDAPPAAPDALHWFGLNSVLDQRAGGGLLLIGCQPPPDFSSATAYSPTSLSVLRAAHEAGGRVVARTPYAWDLPVWLASGKIDAIELVNHHSLRDGVANNEDDGRPRDRSFFPGAAGNGRWSEAVYFHVLNCGLRIPPVAGSGSGENDNPLGMNRVYAYCGDEFSYERWWRAVDAGAVFVTNGPLLRPKVEGRPPGHVFTLGQGRSIDFEIGLNLATRMPVEYLQIVKNGEVAADVRLAEWKDAKGRLPVLSFSESGWFLVRAVTNNRRTYQLASSGPYYVEAGSRPRVSRRSVQFILDWIDAARARIAALKDIDETQRSTLLAEQDDAREFFAELMAKANAE